MSHPKSHKDVEFHTRDDKVFKTIEDAAGHAVIRGLGISAKQFIDVCIWSEDGAFWYGGNSAVEQYREDPEASVFERITLIVDSQGRVA